MISAKRLAEKWGYRYTEPKTIRAFVGKETDMTHDIEVIEWDYKVYFERESDQQARLVYCFETEKEAETCVFLIKEHGLEAWYTPVRTLKYYKEGE